jgi:hypothetical protein
MDASQGAIWFFGDLNDPWVVSIADALPGSYGVRRIDCPGQPPGQSSEAGDSARLVVMHRQRLVRGDADWLTAWRTKAGEENAPALILCVGPYVRYEELERYSGLVDLVLSEATAAEVLPRHVARMLEGRQIRAPRPHGDLFRLVVASSDGELGRTVAEACAAAGFCAEQADDQVVGAGITGRNEPSVANENILTIWDVPVLESWSDRLERHALHAGPVIALMGFADRATVGLARSRGAIACLELPLNLDDLIDVIDRFGRSLPVERRTVPARPEPPHLLPPRPRRRIHEQAGHPEVTPWPAQSRLPTIDE